MEEKWRVVLYVATPIVAAVVMNVAIYATELGRNRKQAMSSLLPPGWVVGMIWVILFGLLGYVLYLHRQSSWMVVSLVLFIIYCLMYPVYTRGLDGRSMIAKLANLGTLVLAFIITVVIAQSTKTKKNSLYMVPVLLWALYVNIVDVIECGRISSQIV